MRPSFEDLDHPGYSDDPNRLRIFLDTEFSDLVRDAKLLSIGLIDETGERTFYAELSDDDCWHYENASDFAKVAVLPLLEGGECMMTMAELSQRLAAWLTAFGEPVKIATDSLAWDWRWIQELFREPGTWPANLDTKPLLLTMSCLNEYDAFEEAVEAAFADGLRQHHALDDAKANRLGWIAAGGDVEKVAACSPT